MTSVNIPEGYRLVGDHEILIEGDLWGQGDEHITFVPVRLKLGWLKRKAFLTKPVIRKMEEEW